MNSILTLNLDFNLSKIPTFAVFMKVVEQSITRSNVPARTNHAWGGGGGVNHRLFTLLHQIFDGEL